MSIPIVDKPRTRTQIALNIELESSVPILRYRDDPPIIDTNIPITKPIIIPFFE